MLEPHTKLKPHYAGSEARNRNSQNADSSFLPIELMPILIYIMQVHIISMVYISAIGNAFAVLSDDKKRREYDLYGEQEAAKGQREWDYSHGCEADMSPEEIFNMFFSGAMNGGTAHVFRRQRQSEEVEQTWAMMATLFLSG